MKKKSDGINISINVGTDKKKTRRKRKPSTRKPKTKEPQLSGEKKNLPVAPFGNMAPMTGALYSTYMQPPKPTILNAPSSFNLSDIERLFKTSQDEQKKAFERLERELEDRKVAEKISNETTPGFVESSSSSAGFPKKKAGNPQLSDEDLAEMDRWIKENIDDSDEEASAIQSNAQLFSPEPSILNPPKSSMVASLPASQQPGGKEEKSELFRTFQPPSPIIMSKVDTPPPFRNVGEPGGYILNNPALLKKGYIYDPKNGYYTDKSKKNIYSKEDIEALYPLNKENKDMGIWKKSFVVKI